jgi:alkylation response protein AidB-like acyl-CoA dehydrogenase
VEIEAQAGEVLYSPAGRIDVGDPDAAVRAAAAKLLVTRSATAAAQTGVAAFGNLTITERNLPARHLRDIRCSRIHPPAGRRTARRRPPRAARSSS